MNCMNRLEKLRKSRNLSQTQVADELKITQQAYSNYENGKREADHTTLSKLSIYFNTTVDYLLGLTDDPTPPNKKGSSDGESDKPEKYDLLTKLAIKLLDNLPEDKKELAVKMLEAMSDKNESD